MNAGLRAGGALPGVACFTIAVLSAATPCLSAQASSTDTLRLAEAVQLALQANPMLQAARAAAVAARERVGPAGALPDPQIQFNTMNRAGPTYSYAGNVMTQNQQQLVVTIPWPWKLRSAHRAAEYTAPRGSSPATSGRPLGPAGRCWRATARSEEHTSELQSRQ